MKNCLIYQPCGLGDIIWLQPVIDRFINLGYEVHFPVINLYYEMLKEQLIKKNLIWHKENDDFPLKNFYGTQKIIEENNNLYLPISFANYYLNQCSVMISKYYFTNTPITNWHKSFEIKRNYEKEQKLFKIYGVDVNKPYSLMNMTYGTPPNHRTRKIQIDCQTDQIISMSFEKDQKNNFNLFDWIGLIENASEIHTVETSICYLIDKYAKTDKLFMYEKRHEEESPTYYRLVNLVYRNTNWSYLN
jgi:hypothetical protein